MPSFDTNTSLLDMFQQQLELRADKTIIDFQGKKHSFEQLHQQSDSIAAGLQLRGLGKGDRIGLYCINSDYNVIAYLAIIKTGAVAVPLNLLLPVSELEYILNDADVSAIIYHPLFEDNVEQLKSLVVRAKYWIVIDESGSEDSWGELLKIADAPQAVVFDADNDLAAILYTSGTTGHPKGAMLSHSNLVANTMSCLESLKMDPDKDVLLVVIPMFHSFAHTLGMLTPVLNGGCLVPLPKFDIQLVADSIQQTQASIFMGVPTMYAMLLELPAGEEAKFQSIRYGISGGAAMPLALMERFEQRFGFPIYEGDGPTECSPVTCVNPIDGLRKPGSVGLPIAGVEMSIRDDLGQPIADNEMGEICVRGNNVMKGYWKQELETARVFFEDWYRTGDIGYRDDEGYFYIADRLKDMVIVNGENVYPKMVEDVLYSCPGILEVAVIGQPDELHGEIPIAYVVKDNSHPVDAATIAAYCEDKLAKFEIPREVQFIEALPKTPTGKVLKRELRKHYQKERGIVSE